MDRSRAIAGELLTLPTKPHPVEQLTVRIEVEPFTTNDARVYVIARMRSDAPDEIAFSVYQHEDSAPVEELTLTATMGNYERLRHLWLRGRIVEGTADLPDTTVTFFLEVESSRQSVANTFTFNVADGGYEKVQAVIKEFRDDALPYPGCVLVFI